MIDELRLEQQQQLSQQQIQSLQLLAMDNIELEGFLQNEHLENPLLEYSSQGTGLRKGEVDAFWNRDIRESAAEENKIKPYLQEQLPMEKFTQKEWELFEFLIDCLDEHGFFKGNIEEIAKMNHVSCQSVEKCLEELRLLEPVGIFAENLQECLLRQLEVLGISNPDLEKIIKEHLEDVAEGKISSISRELKLSTLQVRKYIAMIEHLNPCPMAGFSTGETKYIVPDMIAVQGESGWEILLNDSWMGDYGLN
ncbi:MAG: RNA polymerase sigma-54 factor, partial [Acetivibrio ethanolgignens]